MVLHKDIAITNMHHPYNWIYADTSTREAATGFTSDDIGGFAFQEDDFSIWVLTDDSPVTWSEVGSGGGGTPGGSDTQIQYNDAGTFAGSDKLAWTEGVDETDSALTVDGTVIGYSFLSATSFSTPSLQSVGNLNLVMVDELQINGDGGSAGEILTSNGAGNSPTWEPNTGGYTDEQAQDAVGAMVSDTSSIDVTYTDGTPELTWAIKDEYLMDWLGALIADSTNIDVTYNDGANTFVIDLTAAARTFGTSFLIDGGGSVIVTGVKGRIVVERASTIIGVTMVADASGNLVCDIKKSAYSGFPTVSSIVASAPPTLSGAQKSQDTTLTGWTTSVAAGDVLEISVTGTPATITQCTLAIKFQAA